MLVKILETIGEAKNQANDAFMNHIVEDEVFDM